MNKNLVIQIVVAAVVVVFALWWMFFKGSAPSSIDKQHASSVVSLVLGERGSLLTTNPAATSYGQGIPGEPQLRQEIVNYRKELAEQKRTYGTHTSGFHYLGATVWGSGDSKTMELEINELMTVVGNPGTPDIKYEAKHTFTLTNQGGLPQFGNWRITKDVMHEPIGLVNPERAEQLVD